MKTYRYQGMMPSCLPLKTGDVTLSPGATVELPEDVDVVATLEAKGLLVAVAGETPSEQAEAGGTPAVQAEAGETPAVPAEAGETPAVPGRKRKENV